MTLAMTFPLVADAAEGIKLVNPRPTQFKAIEIRTTNEHFARFEGQAQIDGTLYVEWSAGSPPIAEYRLIPSQQAVKKLPHFRRYRVTWIEPFDGQATLRTAVDESTVRRVTREHTSFRVNGVWSITQYEVGIECDAPFARAKVVAVLTPKRVAAVERPETC